MIKDSRVNLEVKSGPLVPMTVRVYVQALLVTKFPWDNSGGVGIDDVLHGRPPISYQTLLMHSPWSGHSNVAHTHSNMYVFLFFCQVKVLTNTSHSRS